MRSTVSYWKHLADWLWQRQGFIWSTLVLGVLLNVAATLLTTSGFDPQKTPLGWLLEHPWLTSSGIVLLLGQSIFG